MEGLIGNEAGVKVMLRSIAKQWEGDEYAEEVPLDTFLAMLKEG